MTLTQESVLSFLLERGGKVKNSELLNHFRTQINRSDPAEKQHNRELFKKLVNSVAVVKQIDEVKFVVVKKRYQDFVREAERHDASQETQMDDTLSSQNTSFSFASPHRAEEARLIYSDIQNNNISHVSNMNGSYYGGVKHVSLESMQNTGNGADSATVKVLNITGDQASRARRSGAVFAVVAVKSPPRDTAAQDGLHPRVNQPKPPDVKKSHVPTVDSDHPTCEKTAQCGRSRLTECAQLTGFPQSRPPNRARHTDDAKYAECVPLQPLVHEWLVKCAAGLWGQIYALLLQDTGLAQRKDFMSGFTALHWAAKGGNSEMMHKLIDAAEKRGAHIDINSKAHGGYTPLHIAAIHGHTEVMVLLVRGYGADVNTRDNDGKKALHYLGSGVSDEIREILGGLQQSKDKEKTEDEECREHQKGFNTISKLFQPHIGKKQKASVKFAHDW